MNLPSRYTPTGRTFGGGQGIVSVWRDVSLNREVAVKELSTSGMGGSLREEAALLSAIRSKHVVELFEFGTDSSTGKDYLIMEFVSGAELVRYRPPDLRALYLTLYQIASGIVDIHAAGCIHRDLKPGNLKRDGSDIIKIIDFGIGANRNLVLTGTGRGTTGYRGAEYYLDPIQLTPACDIYAFGAIAYEFCFGNLNPVLLNHPPTIPPSFGTTVIGVTRVSINAEIVSVLDRCFDGIPSVRPTALELKTLFAKHLSHNQHVADFVYDDRMYKVTNVNNSYRISASKGLFVVSYDGLDFLLTEVVGEVYVNGVAAPVGLKLPNSCVITIGAGSGPNRRHIPFNVSHPEVIL